MARYREILDCLISNGMLSSWKVVTVSEDGEEGVEGKFRNTERMYLTFPNVEILTLETFCSGSAEHSVFT